MIQHIKPVDQQGNRVMEIPVLAKLRQDADYFDIKTAEGTVSLRQLVAQMMGYMPRWLQGLYWIRKGFVRLLGMRQEGMPQAVAIDPDEVSFTPGEYVTFFQVEAAEEERYWLSGAHDRHLKAYLGIVREDVGNGRSRFHVITIVHYQHWTGPIYFNVIRPFHHIVVRSMLTAGVQHT